MSAVDGKQKFHVYLQCCVDPSDQRMRNSQHCNVSLEPHPSQAANPVSPTITTKILCLYTVPVEAFCEL